MQLEINELNAAGNPEVSTSPERITLTQGARKRTNGNEQVWQLPMFSFFWFSHAPQAQAKGNPMATWKPARANI